MREILEAVLSPNATSADFAALEVPESSCAIVLRKDEDSMFEHVSVAEWGPRRSLHVTEVLVPEFGLGEVLVAGWPAP